VPLPRVLLLGLLGTFPAPRIPDPPPELPELPTVLVFDPPPLVPAPGCLSLERSAGERGTDGWGSSLTSVTRLTCRERLLGEETPGSERGGTCGLLIHDDVFKLQALSCINFVLSVQNLN
jgi:hypothetical protein